MFGFHTPKKTMGNDQGPSTQTTEHGTSPQAQRVSEATRAPIPSVRRSIGEWENGKPTEVPRPQLASPKRAEPVEAPKAKQKTLLSQESRVIARRASTEATGSPPTQSKAKYTDRMAEARACVTKAKLHLGNSRNIKTEIKTEVTQAIERLYQLVKESETAKGQGNKKIVEQPKGKPQEEEKKIDTELGKEGKELMRRMNEHAQLIRENSERMEKLKETIERDIVGRATYASVAAAPPRRQAPERTALHSVVVSSTDDRETGEDVLDRIRKVVNVKESGIEVEKVRKAKDKKVIVGCRTDAERQRLKDRLQGAKELHVEEVRNKDPLVILRDVLKYNTDEDIIAALKNHKGMPKGEPDVNMQIAYKKRTRNPHTQHVIVRVAPKVWQHLTEVGSVQIDLQRIKVADQSPLVQCSLCLGYGHGRRFCKETVEKCCHCGGPHMKAQCESWLAEITPTCPNCTHAKLERTDHNAFSGECPIRRRWENLARATVAYC